MTFVDSPSVNEKKRSQSTMSNEKTPSETVEEKIAETKSEFDSVKDEPDSPGGSGNSSESSDSDEEPPVKKPATDANKAKLILDPNGHGQSPGLPNELDVVEGHKLISLMREYVPIL
jgi:hypothetical protein